MTIVHALGRPEDWWTIGTGSGFRGAVERLTAFERGHVRSVCEASLREARVASLATNAVGALAPKPDREWQRTRSGARRRATARPPRGVRRPRRHRAWSA